MCRLSHHSFHGILVLFELPQGFAGCQTPGVEPADADGKQYAGDHKGQDRGEQIGSTSNHPALERRAGEHAMPSVSTKPACSQPATEASPALLDDWFDPIEAGLRERVRGLSDPLSQSVPETHPSLPAYRNLDNHPILNQHQMRPIDSVK